MKRNEERSLAELQRCSRRWTNTELVGVNPKRSVWREAGRAQSLYGLVLSPSSLRLGGVVDGGEP